MARLSLWKPHKGLDFKFIDRVVAEHLYAGGTGVHVHKYLGVPQNINSANGLDIGSSENVTGEPSETFIQDLLFLENRDRSYDDTIYIMRGQYNILDNDAYDLTQFGLFLSNDTLFMTFHIESMVETLGRKLMPGDVLELPHLRDDLLLGREDAANRFYVVQEGTRPADGYDPGWWPHLWRVKLTPMPDSPEYNDILGDGTEDDDLRNLVSQYANDIKINDGVLAEAAAEVKWDPQYRRNEHLYFDPAVPDKPTIGFEYAGAGYEPPNGAAIIGSGSSFPDDAKDCDYFLRTDFTPSRIFQKDGDRWKNISTDNRYVWATADRLLTSFINNDDTSVWTNGTTQPVKTNLSKVIRPKTDD